MPQPVSLVATPHVIDDRGMMTGDERSERLADVVDLTRTLRAQTGRRPLIGLTATVTEVSYGVWEDERAAVLNESYLNAVIAAGGRPVILPALGMWSEDEIDDLDALILTGGEDVDPASYGEAPHARTGATNPARDRFETSAVHAARQKDVPVLGICRGAQIIDVAHGGALLQHLPEDVPAHPETGTAITEVPVTVDTASEAGRAVGASATVRCYHHQAIGRLGLGLRVVARHASGVIEAIEATDGSFLTAVQWHPELTAHAAPGLFERLVSRAAERAGCRVHSGAEANVASASYRAAGSVA